MRALAGRLARRPNDLAGAYLLAGRVISAERKGEMSTATIEACLVEIRGSLRVFEGTDSVELARIQALVDLLDASERIGARVMDSRNEFQSNLRQTLRDPARSVEVRAGALHALASWEDAEVATEAREILESPEKPESLPLRRRAAGIWKAFTDESGTALLARILKTTSDVHVFGTAGNSLSRIGGEEAYRALIDGSVRFAGRGVGFAIAESDTFLLNWLGGANDEDFSRALHAIDFVRPVGHPSAPPHPLRETQRTLKSLLLEPRHARHRKEMLQILLRRLAPEEAHEIRDALPDSPEYHEEWQRLDRLARSVEAKSQQGSVVPPERRVRGVVAARELGDVGFKKIGFLQEWPILGDFGHCGIYSGFKQNPWGEFVGRSIEVDTPLGSDVVHENDWAPMDCGEPNCWGAYTLDNVSLTFSGRRDLVLLAEQLITENLSYALIASIDLCDALNVGSLPGLKIDRWEISRIRCDGLVEYCYEYFDHAVWGPGGTLCNITDPTCLEEHNDLYVPYFGDPDHELAPIAQCGRAGGSSTHLRASARILPPEGSLRYTSTQVIPGLYAVDLTFDAWDESGIHFISYSTDGGLTFVSSPRQGGIPNSDALRFEDEIYLNASRSIDFYAMDNGGNVPAFCFSGFVDVDRDDPAATVSSLRVHGAQASWVVESEQETRAYAVETAPHLSGPWREVARDAPGVGAHEVQLQQPTEQLVRLVEEEHTGDRLFHSYAAGWSSVHGDAAERRDLAEPARADSLRCVLRTLPPISPHLAATDRLDRSVPHKDLLIVTVDEFLSDVREFVEGFWEEFFGYDVDVVSLGEKTDPEAEVRRSFVRALVALYSLSRETQSVLLVGDANDWQEFDGPLASQYWVGPWAALREDLLESGYPAGGQPSQNIIPTFALADTAPRGTNMAYVAPYVLADAPYVGGRNAVVTRWPCSSIDEVLAMALKMQVYNRGVPISEGAPSGLCFVGDLDFDDPGDGALAWNLGQDLLARMSSHLEPHPFYRSSWGIPVWLIGEAASLWNSLPGLRLVATVGSLSTRYRPVDILNKEEWSFPFDVASLLGSVRTPLVVGASCSTADFARTERLAAQPLGPTPICEDFLFTPGKGAVAWVGPTCGTWQLGNGVIASTFLEELFEDPRRPMAASWRETTRRIAVEYPPSHPVHETLAAYVFLGDPFSPFEPPLVPVAAPVLAPSVSFGLETPSPNPFHDCARIVFSLPVESEIDLAVHDVRGRRVATLLSERRPAGRHEVEWPGVDDQGLVVSPGIYFVRAKNRGRALTRKVVRIPVTRP